MAVVKKVFKNKDLKINAYTLTSSKLSVTVIDYGATMTHFTLLKEDFNVDVLLGYDDPFDYIHHPKNCYFGSIVGRSCNRTANGSFELNNQTYQLQLNNGPNSLHGGAKGFDKRFWKADVVDSVPFVQFELLSEDGEEGYPGKIRTRVTYSINDDTLNIETQVDLIDDAIKETFVNITAHPYFNLSGGKLQTIESHIVHMKGVKGVLEIDDTQIPTGNVLTMESNPELIFDTATSIDTKLPLVQQFRGFDHFYLAQGTPFITVCSPQNNIVLEVSSDCAGFQFYTANWVENQPSKSLHSCGLYSQYSGFCIEPSQPPNAINIPEYRDSVIVTPQKPWYHKISYKLYVQ
jgi:aldose 1-epimerase